MFTFLFLLATAACGADLRVGIVGTDTSHAQEFTRILNDPNAKDHVAGARVVAAWEGGSPDIKESASRRDKIAAELRDQWHVTFYPDIATLCKNVDAILIESLDGRVHLEQARQVFAAHKPVFIDKPLSDSLAGAQEIAKLAKQNGVAWFSSSSLRYADWVQDLRSPGNLGVMAWGPGPQEAHQKLDLSWYAIHPIEMLYTLMGPGCTEVTRTSTSDADVIVGRWKNGRIGTVRAIRPYSGYGAVVFREKQILQSPPKAEFSYKLLVERIVQFFQTGRPPVPNDVTLEMFEFMDAAQRSVQSGGRPAKLR
ncbi:MAG TPA: Gfo/Idh/MocA family oxidoreductase [Bryobacteraceae bacterium]|nr:Gfo/Idh/MocA family oxidoreductase [Bryobacteraceae bacterium]